MLFLDFSFVQRNRDLLPRLRTIQCDACLSTIARDERVDRDHRFEQCSFRICAAIFRKCLVHCGRRDRFRDLRFGLFIEIRLHDGVRFGERAVRRYQIAGQLRCSTRFEQIHQPIAVAPAEILDRLRRELTRFCVTAARAIGDNCVHRLAIGLLTACENLRYDEQTSN